MEVITRSGKYEKVSFDKITERLSMLCYGLDKKYVDPIEIALETIKSIHNGISTVKLDILSADICAQKIHHHPDFNKLAARILVDNLHKSIDKDYKNVISKCFELKIVSEEFYNFVCENHVFLNSIIDYNRDFDFDYFGFKTLERSYLLKEKIKTKDKIKETIIESPQHMWMRVAIQIHMKDNDLPKIQETYDFMSKMYFTHATPTLFNSGTPRTQLSSCYLLTCFDDITQIFKCISDIAHISKYAGGIGVSLSHIRGKGSIIRGTNGLSDGIIPLCKVLESTGRYINQCFTPDTWVYSKNGPKQMKNITTYDELVTIDGSFKKVNKVIINKVNKEILEIQATNTLFPVKITKEHEIYMIKDKTSFSNIVNQLNEGLIKPEFNSADKLTSDDIVGFPIPTYEKNNDNNDLDFYKFYGMILVYADNFNETNEYYISKLEEQQQFVKNYLEKNNIHYWISKDKICFTYCDLLTKDMLYDENNEKSISNEFLHLPKEKIIKILEGLLLKTNVSYRKNIYFTNTSQKLIMQVRYLLLRLGILTSGHVNKDITEYGCENTDKIIDYSLRIPKHKVLKEILHFEETELLKYFEWNNILWGRIETIEKINYEGDVYDFNMIDNHNYLTDMGLVHNSGKRMGSIAVYLEPYHPDIFEFVELRKNTGDENLRARDLFLALWIPDLFMKRVMEDRLWSLMCPDTCPNLVDTYGEEFEKLYEQYEKEERYVKQVKARDLWKHILENQIETGMPYISYKDHANRKSNQKNIGTIKCSNLCVSQDTLILTKDFGYSPIKLHENQELEIWNGFEWSKVNVLKTGENQELIRVCFRNNEYIDCTRYHKFYIQNGDNVDIITAENLKKDMKIIKCNYPIIDGNEKFDKPYTYGFMSSFHNKFPNRIYEEDVSNEIRNIPSQLCSIDTKIRWLEGFCDKSAYINEFTNELRIQGPSIDFLRKLRLFCHSLGIESEVCKNPMLLVIFHFNIAKLQTLGFKPNILRIDKYSTKNDDDYYIKVSHIEITGEINDTYCFTEPLRHTGIFNGIITGQCNEILEVSSETETAVCNLGSICLPKFVYTDDKNQTIFNFNLLASISEILTKNLNKVIDINFYPTKETQFSNNKNRPIGMGVQGLADTYIKMGYAFDSNEARDLNKLIFETIYFNALKASNEIAIKEGPYETFKGSPMSEGMLQYDMWGLDENKLFTKDIWDWNLLKENIKKYGIRNSLLTALMPTASTAQIMGNSECFEPITSNIYVRKTLAGEFVIVNEYLVRELLELGLWNDDMYKEILYYNGSIQNIQNIPTSIKNKYKTAYEIKGIDILRQSVERGPFIDQTQSLNIFMTTPSFEKLQNSHFFGWKNGLKTGMYYLRTQPAVDPIKFGLDMDFVQKIKQKNTEDIQSTSCVWVRKGQKPPEDCIVCSS